MGALAVAALGGAVIALLALLVVYAFAQLMKAISYAVPTLPIPGGSVLRNAFRTLANTAVAAATHYIGKFLKPIEHVMLWPVYVIVHTVQAIEAGFRASLDAIAWVTGTALPKVLADAQAYAWHLRQQIWAHISEDYYAVKAYAASLFHQAWVHIAEDYYAVKAYAASLFHQAWVHIAEDYYAVKAYSTSLFHQAWAHIAEDYYAVKAYSTSLYEEARHYSLTLYRAAQTAIAQAEARAISTAQAYTRTAITSATGVIATDLVTPIEHVWDDVTDAAEDAITAAAGGLTDVAAGLKSIAGANVKDLAGVGALTGATALTLTRYLRECGVPNCRNLGKFGRDLQDLFKFAEEGALFALLAAMITDPARTAHEVTDVLGPVARAAVNTAEDLVGIR